MFRSEMTAINILRKHVLCATYVGRFLVYSISTGLLMADVHAHARQINSINVAVASAYVIYFKKNNNRKFESHQHQIIIFFIYKNFFLKKNWSFKSY